LVLLILGKRLKGEMENLLSILIFIAGFLVIIVSGEKFVDSACRIADGLHVPRIVIGLTIVSFATTMPEFTVSFMATLLGNVGVAFGNAVGSFIANAGLILALAAIFRPIRVEAEHRIEGVTMLATAIILYFLAMVGRSLNRVDGSILIAILIITLILTFHRIAKYRSQNSSEQNVEASFSIRKPVLVFLVSAAGVAVGSRMLIYGGVRIAELLGVPEIVIGLTMIAVGTSIPELVTAAMSIRRKVVELSLGNIFGANILNLSWILGACSLIKSLPVDGQSVIFNLPIMMLIAVMLTVFTLAGSKITRVEGSALIAVYIFYTAALYAYMY